MKRPAFQLGLQGGCNCQQCLATSRYLTKGFAHWPKGESATPREARALYARHAAAAWFDARKSERIGATGAGFYGVPAGLTKAQVDATLRATFSEAA